MIDYKPRFVMPTGKITKAKLNKFDRSIKRWDNLIKRGSEERIKHLLRDNRYLTLEIDTHRNIQTIIDEIRETLKWVNEEKNKYGLKEKYEKSPHLDKYERYLKVFDFRDKSHLRHINLSP
jgi:hypothetical protein